MNLSKNQIKLIRSLGQKKFRQKYQYFVAEGSKIVLHTVKSDANIKLIYALADWIEEHNAILDPVKDKIVPVSSRELKQISFLNTPNDALVLLKMPDDLQKSVDTTKGLHFYVDRIQNPGNLGAIIRIADWFGFDSVIASENCVDFYNEKTIQASMGAFLNVKMCKASIQDLQYDQLITSSLDGKNLYQTTQSENAIIVISNEGEGVSDELAKLSTLDVFIPPHPSNGSESLNASVAAGIIASYIRQQSINT